MFSAGGSWVYLDATRIGRKKLYIRFPNIHQFLQSYELDLAQDLIPVSPSAHYWMGGVRTGLDGETSIPGFMRRVKSHVMEYMAQIVLQVIRLLEGLGLWRTMPVQT